MADLPMFVPPTTATTKAGGRGGLRRQLVDQQLVPFLPRRRGHAQSVGQRAQRGQRMGEPRNLLSPRLKIDGHAVCGGSARFYVHYNIAGGRPTQSIPGQNVRETGWNEADSPRFATRIPLILPRFCDQAIFWLARVARAAARRERNPP